MAGLGFTHGRVNENLGREEGLGLRYQGSWFNKRMLIQDDMYLLPPLIDSPDQVEDQHVSLQGHQSTVQEAVVARPWLVLAVQGGALRHGQGLLQK